MKARLLAADGLSGKEFGLPSLPVVLGRSYLAGIQVLDRFVSRRHCQIEERDGCLVVRDLESKHGTYVNGEQIQESKLLPGDTLSVGITSFRADYDTGSLEALVSVNGSLADLD